MLKIVISFWPALKIKPVCFTHINFACKNKLIWLMKLIETNLMIDQQIYRALKTVVTREFIRILFGPLFGATQLGPRGPTLVSETNCCGFFVSWFKMLVDLFQLYLREPYLHTTLLLALSKYIYLFYFFSCHVFVTKLFFYLFFCRFSEWS